ncbi:hypothetical protein OJAV_G00082750 [Oryzias javanicus]|uniref:Uncharacterized protein n=1 Tax=Oryzias javanicus TaxID=123683 RepID=A0A3S2PUD1_ORYJA|nr:hypothetical protein OJAV_G00082750 [Oryzias javanicus]
MDVERLNGYKECQWRRREEQDEKNLRGFPVYLHHYKASCFLDIFTGSGKYFHLGQLESRTLWSGSMKLEPLGTERLQDSLEVTDEISSSRRSWNTLNDDSQRSSEAFNEDLAPTNGINEH